MSALSDYRTCKYMTKEQLKQIALHCGTEIPETITLKKDMIDFVIAAQKNVISRIGRLYEGEY